MTVVVGTGRPVWAEVDLGAIRHNASVLASAVSPAQLCAVVKADGYGHGAEEAARAAIAGGARCLAVALVEEGAALRASGIEAPILLLSEPPHDSMHEVVTLGLTPTLYTEAGLQRLESAAEALQSTRGQPVGVHVKVDTGMHRVGAAPAEAVTLALAVAACPTLRLEGLWTHFAVADDASHPFTAEQARRFRAVADELVSLGVRPPLLHTCNSAGALGQRDCRYDLVRCGIAVYGVPPSADLEGIADLRPALSLRARVSFVKEVGAGEGVSYGLRYTLERRSVVATVPVGYADGVPWRLGVTGGEVLLAGRRLPIAGSVTMDQILVDCGPDASVATGEEVVLLGAQGGEQIGAWEWSRRVGTIPYEVLCGIGPRVPKVYV